METNNNKEFRAYVQPEMEIVTISHKILLQIMTIIMRRLLMMSFQ